MKLCRIGSTALVFLFVLLILVYPVNESKADAAPFDPNKIVEYALSKVGSSAESGMCLKWVADSFRDCYQTTRYSSCCAGNFGIKYRDSSSRDNIPLGADVFFSGFYGSGNDTCSSCGNKYGHIGIYVGDGYVVHSWGGKIRKDKIDWLLGLSNSGKLNYYGWGWHGNMEFRTESITPTDTKSITSGSVYSLCNHASGKYITVPTTYNSSNNDVGKGHVLVNAPSSASDQKIKFTTGNDGAWILYPQSLSSGRIIETYMADASRSYPISGDRISLFYLNNTTPNCGQFVVKWVSEGVCALLIRGSQNLAVAPQNAAAASTNMSDLYLVEYTGANWQHWRIQNSTGGWVLGEHTHSYGNWKHNGSNHWKECSCGAQGYEGAHTWNSGVVTTPPTEASAGIRTYACTVCARTRTESIPATGYTLTVLSADNTMGSVSGGGTYTAGASATIKATSNAGYEFVAWDDGSTSATRTITVSSNATYTARFKKASSIVDAAQFTAANVTAQPGGYADVTVSVAKNPGISGFNMAVMFDNTYLTVESVFANTNLIPSVTYNVNQTAAANRDIVKVVGYSGDGDFFENGTIFTIRFKVDEIAEAGTSEVRLALGADSVCNANLESIPFSIKHGSVSISSFHYGDIYEDGSIDIRDLVYLAQYVAGKPLTPANSQKMAMDVYNDGTIDIRDLVKLAQYIAGRDVKLGTK